MPRKDSFLNNQHYSHALNRTQNPSSNRRFSTFGGLFGTVWGIYHALIGISVAGQATIDKVAGPVGEALIMTAFGLAVAIPAVLGFNALNRANKSMLTQLNRFAHDLHAYFVTGGRLIKHLKKTS